MNGNFSESIIIQVVPRRAEADGVANHALALAGALRICSGINSLFLSGMPAVQDISVQNGWKTVSLLRRKAEVLARTIQSLSADTKALAVILHYSGYGYQNRGAPFWLVHGLRIWRRRGSQVPLITIFHELYATGRPWQSSFWLCQAQKRIARSILNLSSAAITPTNTVMERLLHWHSRSGAEIRCMPVFSNVGETGCGSLPRARAATAVVLGLAGVEVRLYGIYRPQIERCVVAMGIEKILDIGPRFSSVPSSLEGVPVISKGILPQAAVSKLLGDARFGFVAYPLDFIAKSGVFAAYAANGVVPIVFSEKRGPFDGLEAGRHFLDGFQLEASASEDRLASIQHELSAWYASHCLEVQAGLLERFITASRLQPSATDTA